MAASSSPDFWGRLGLQERDRKAHMEAVQGVYPGRKVDEFQHQGYCSFTLIVHPWSCTSDSSSNKQHEDGINETETLIVQIRPPQYALSLNITNAATKLYPGLAPRTIRLTQGIKNDLIAYVMPKLPGEPMSLLQPRVRSPGAEIYKKQITLIKDFAASLAQSWHSASQTRRFTRADSPVMASSPNIFSHCPGKVGSAIIPKLRLLAHSLPSAALRQRAQTVLEKIQTVDAHSYPVVLTHGDLIPSNILVDKHTWRITGLVDWAEAEDLPFGTCLYGLEHLLGYMPSTAQFVYFDSAPRLRTLFWERLWEAVPELRTKRDEVGVVRDLGVLLWHGFAWDEGSIDRVVEEGRDRVEVVRLRTFLGVE